MARAGPGGGAIEGPPLLNRKSAGSAHGGLEYFKCGCNSACSSTLRHFSCHEALELP